MTAQPPRPERPFVSVVIPTYNRPGQLAACLDSLTRLDYPADRFEVVVVDDGSATPLDGVVDAVSDRVDLRLHRQRNAGPAAARNAGAERARGVVLAFTDDDCAPEADWLDHAARAHVTGAAIGGRSINVLDDNPYSTASQMITNFIYERLNADATSARFLATNNLAVPAESFRGIGGFDTSFPLAAGEDRKLCDDLRQAGVRLVYDDAMVVRHAHPLGFRGYVRQHFNYGRGAYRIARAGGEEGSDRIALAPPGFYVGLLRYPFRTGGRTPLRSEGLVLLSQIATSAGFVWEGLRRKGRP